IEDAQTPMELLQPTQDREVSPEDVVEDFHERLCDFIPDSEHRVDSSAGGKLEEDMRVEEDIYPNAVRILRTDKTLHEIWKRNFGNEGGDQKFSPFDSETDWCFAEWAIKSGVGHKQLDRLLAIPRLVDKAGLSYSNTRNLLKFLEDIPAQAKWELVALSFKDMPKDRYLKALLGDPVLAKDIVYKPKRIFTTAKRDKNEMWMGRWW
ncbi:hypothetical protein SCLCIDRAFT_74926, partial [Scleroderma citrinum Foug A]